MTTTAAATDLDFTYFLEGEILKATCNYCGITMDASEVENHRKTCKENPRDFR